MSDMREVRRQAGWLPETQEDLEQWLDGHRSRTADTGRPLHPVMREFEQLLDDDPVLRMYVHRMVQEQPRGRQYTRRHVDSVDELLQLMNEVLYSAPEFGEKGMVSTPLGAVLDWPMGTPAGFAAFRDDRLNAMLRKVLNAWGEFLSGPDSRYVLNDSPTGWTSPAARVTVGIDQFEHDPDDEHWGFASWNDFFTRRFRPGVRPVAAPEDASIVVSACEATPYRIATDVQHQDEFWIKQQPYSLRDMLASDPAAEDLVGGTVFQAFLSATNYHRWHSPVDGTVLRCFVQLGTYFSEDEAAGDESTEPKASQGYLAHVATRAVVIIDADNPQIGRVALVFVGMVDVSSCVFADGFRPGRHLAKGDELGWFQFGGSTYCAVFGPGVIDSFNIDAIPQSDAKPPLLQVRAAMASVRRPERTTA